MTSIERFQTEVQAKGKIIVYASGTSVNELPFDFINRRRFDSYQIFVNYAFTKYPFYVIDALAFADGVVGNALISTINNEHHGKLDVLLFTRDRDEGLTKDYQYRIPLELKGEVKYHYTLSMLIATIRKHIDDSIPVYIFGLDSDGKDKYYTKYTNLDIESQKLTADITKLHRHIQCDKELEYFKDRNIFNCNTNSKSTAFQLLDYKIFFNYFNRITIEEKDVKGEINTNNDKHGTEDI